MNRRGDSQAPIPERHRSKFQRPTVENEAKLGFD